jgi:WD40 repeat protein
MHEGAAMRVIETKGLIQQLEYTPDGRCLVFVERWDNNWLVRWFELATLTGACAAEYGRLHRLRLALKANRFFTIGGWGEGITMSEFVNGRLELAGNIPYESAWSLEDVSKDSKYLAYFQGHGHPRDRNQIFVQEFNSQKVIATFRTQEHVNSLIFSSDGSYLTSVAERELTIWSLQKNESVAVWKLPRKRRSEKAQSRIQSVTVSPDGRFLFIRGNGRLYIWEAASDIVLLELPLAKDVGFALGCSWDSSLFALAISPMENEVQLWDVNDMRQVQTFQWPLYTSRCISFAPDGMTIAASSDNKVIIWDLDDL